jgi:RimJ/RimL family protein N-acetyltransferase
VVVEVYKDDDAEEIRAMLNDAIEDGDSYPYEAPMDAAAFRAYFLSHECLVLRATATQEVIGAAYIKPNFPGRCSHICNGGFLVHQAWRRRGAATILAGAFLPAAMELGYRRVFFNLVFVTNEASLRLWDSMGFHRVGVIPEAGLLKGHGYVDAVQFTYDLTQPRSSPAQPSPSLP